jgi:hypothetical protein
MRRVHKFILGALIVVAAAVGGALAPDLFGAGAATGTTSTTTTTSASPGRSNEEANHESGESAAREAAEDNGTATFGHHGDGHGTAAHEDAEKSVTGAAAAKAQAAAVKAVGSGTAGAVTSDRPGTGYEVTVTKTDGSTVDVHLDSSFTVQQDGHAAGDASASA